MGQFRKLFGALAIFGATITASTAAPAQSVTENPAVEIRNNSDETRKICFDKPKRVTLLAIGCVTLKKGEHIFWNRKGIFTPFKVKIYQKRKVIDKYLYSRDLPADTGKVIVGTGGRFGFARFKNIEKKYSVRACNQDRDETVWFSLGFDVPNMLVSEGWWNLKTGECKTIPVTERLKSNWNISARTLPRIYYFARTYGDNPVYWSKGNKSREFCIDLDKKYATRGAVSGLCSQGMSRRPFRYLATPEAGSDTMYLTF